MISVSVNCLLIGDNFDPSMIEKVIKLESEAKEGELGNIGRFKNKLNPHGSASLVLGDTKNKDESQLDFVLSQLTKKLQLIKDAKVQEIFLTINLGYTEQCNWEFTKDQLKRISILDISLSISCYRIEN